MSPALPDRQEHKNESGCLFAGYLILGGSGSEIIFELRLGFELSEKQVAQGKAGFCIAGIVNSGDDAAVRDLPGPFQQIVALPGKQFSEDTRLQFGAGSVPTGITEVAGGKDWYNQGRMLGERSQSAVLPLEHRRYEIGIDIGITKHAERIGIFTFKIGVDNVADQLDRVVFVVDGFLLLIVGPRNLGGKGYQKVALIYG